MGLMKEFAQSTEAANCIDVQFPLAEFVDDICVLAPSSGKPVHDFSDPVNNMRASEFPVIQSSLPDIVHSEDSAGTESSSATSSPESPKYEIADILNLYWQEYQRCNPVTPRQYKVVYDILNCRTGSFGYSISACDTCGHTEMFPNSCRNSHCPKCQGRKRIERVESRLDDLLPVPYYHSVFTLPDMIFPLCLYNQKVIYDLLFDSTAATLHEFGYDPKWLGGKTGFFMVLHTWGQQLPVHPHVHCVIPAGGYNQDTCEWVHPKYEKNSFLFPVRALSRVFRGKFIDGLKQAFHKEELQFPGELERLGSRCGFEAWLNDLVSKDWVVYSKAPFGGPEDVVRYVGRYTHRVAISNSRILSIDNGTIRFTFKNYKKMKEVEEYSDLWEETELSADEFIRRFLYHVLPLRYHRIRYYGFLSNNNKALRHEILEYLVFEEETGLPEIPASQYAGIPCAVCETGVLVPLVIVDGSGNILRGSFAELLEFRKDKERQFILKRQSVPLMEASETS